MKSDKFTEFSLIEKIKKNIRRYNKDVYKGIGDDAAAVKAAKDKYLLYTCDALVSGVHFSQKYASAYQVGQKAAAVNLSDIAAMGGIPKHFLVSLFLPIGISEKFINELYKGILNECRKFDVDVIGGNIARNNKLIVDLFLTGEASFPKPLLRGGAKPGDLVLVTGTLGDSGAGLKILQNPNLKISAEDKKFLILRHLSPTPRVQEGQIIAKSERANAMIDISDGLSSDISHICKESQVGVKLYTDKIPVSDSLRVAAEVFGIPTLDLALNGGEDYELCFTVPAKFAPIITSEIEKSVGTKVTIIGEIAPQKQGRVLIDKGGKESPLNVKGWDHFDITN